jgi:SAM-dependent methyltransferase
MQPASIDLSSDLLLAPTHDPTPIFDLARYNFATELLAAAVAHFNVFDVLSRGAMSFDGLRDELGLGDRAATVLVVALRAMALIVPAQAGSGRLDLSPSAREHLAPGGPFYMGDYLALSAQNPGVLEIAQRLRTNRPAFDKSPDADAGATAFIYREGTESAMDHEASARRLTLALSGRAKNVAPLLARNYPLPEANRLLDAGGGTGIYSLALLAANPQLRAVVWDRAEVLKVAREFAEHAGLAGRVDLVPGDMFADRVPAGCDVILLSNILHDWDVPECRKLVGRCADSLPPGGRLLIHDVFLNDAMDGPLPVALYSASLFSITEGRAYSAAEYREFLTEAGLSPEPVVPTGVHCGVLAGRKA